MKKIINDTLPVVLITLLITSIRGYSRVNIWPVL